MNAREVIKILEADGWYLKSQKGSHMQLIHNEKPGKVTDPIHGNRDIIKPVIANIWKQAGLK